MALIAVNSAAEFESAVLKSPTPVIAGFTADWCPHCKRLAPHIQAFAEQMPQLTIARVDADKAADVCEKYGIMTIPTLAVFKDGQMLASKMVAQSAPEDIQTFIQGALQG